MKIVSISITEQLLEKLQEEQKRSGLTKSDLLRRSLEQYLEKKNGKPISK